jgi:hypothetical protein
MLQENNSESVANGVLDVAFGQNPAKWAGAGSRPKLRLLTI